MIRFTTLALENIVVTMEQKTFPLSGGGILCTQGPWIMQCTIMHNYAQFCTIMHDYAGCIATKTHRDCKQEGTWDCDPPQTDSTVKSAAAIRAYFGQKVTLLSLIFRRWNNFIVRQNIFSSGSMCRCMLLDKIVHDKHNNKLHWTRVEQTIMHNYAQLCNLAQL